jgi:LysM repeat protein
MSVVLAGWAALPRQEVALTRPGFRKTPNPKSQKSHMIRQRRTVMNMLKNVLFFGLLLAVLCGVYLSLNRNDNHPLPQDLSDPLSDHSSSPANSAAPAESHGIASIAPPTDNPPDRSGTFPPLQPSAAPTVPANAGRLTASDNSMSALPPPPTPPFNPPTPTKPASEPPRTDKWGKLGTENASPHRLDSIMQRVDSARHLNRWAEALLILTQIYGDPDLSPSTARVVNETLDNMAAKVIYSRENWLENPYRVQANDTLDKIADLYHVPALLLARINGIRDTQNLSAGKELKVLKGPFSAQISVDHSELTMMLAGCYAGRFNVLLSDDLVHASDMYRVREKSPHTGSGFSPPGSAANKRWIELAGGAPGAPGLGKISIQATNETGVTAGGAPGTPGRSRNTIWLSEQDMEDVYGILSVGSSVVIQR